MKKREIETIEAMPTGSLWTLHEQITAELARRLTSEKRELERKLAKLGEDRSVATGIDSSGEPKPRRKYPRVFPKYFNPSRPSETWSGRGKKPRWLVAQMKAGRKMEDFRIK